MARKLSRRTLATHFANEVLAGASVKKLSRQLAAYLVESRRTSELSLMTREIQYRLSEKGHVMGTVTTAHELSAATKTAIEAFAKQQSNAKSLRLDVIVDESVLGGVKLDLPGHELDATISRQLTNLKTRYKKA